MGAHRNATQVTADNITKVQSTATTQKYIVPPVTLKPLEKPYNDINRTATNVLTTQHTSMDQKLSEDVKIGSRKKIKEKDDMVQNGAYSQSSFSVGSFVGGMALIIVLNVICVFGIRFYKARGSRNYNYLLWGESSN